MAHSASRVQRGRRPQVAGPSSTSPSLVEAGAVQRAVPAPLGVVPAHDAAEVGAHGREPTAASVRGGGRAHAVVPASSPTTRAGADAASRAPSRRPTSALARASPGSPRSSCERQGSEHVGPLHVAVQDPAAEGKGGGHAVRQAPLGVAAGHQDLVAAGQQRPRERQCMRRHVVLGRPGVGLVGPREVLERPLPERVEPVPTSGRRGRWCGPGRRRAAGSGRRRGRRASEREGWSGGQVHAVDCDGGVGMPGRRTAPVSSARRSRRGPGSACSSRGRPCPPRWCRARWSPGPGPRPRDLGDPRALDHVDAVRAGPAPPAPRAAPSGRPAAGRPTGPHPVVANGSGSSSSHSTASPASRATSASRCAAPSTGAGRGVGVRRPALGRDAVVVAEPSQPGLALGVRRRRTSGRSRSGAGERCGTAGCPGAG